jgi:D-beta-D-heptose 7-phosphate kinase/D-beta-D-heptose 1-phosphate adenosyltransferase
MMLQKMQDVVNRFESITALIVGDVMLDRYWWGTVSRISPEAPVPVVRLNRSTLAAGGAANVAANIAGLSAKAILVGLIGDDDGGRELPEVLRNVGVSPENLLTFSGRPTTVKTRIVAHSQHIVRIDSEHEVVISESESQEVARRVLALLPEAHVLVLSDYAKGMLSIPLVRTLIDAALEMGKPVLVDPKGLDYTRYSKATLLTPNRLEAAHACGIDAGDEHAVSISGERLLSEMNVGSCLITQGEDGMTLFRPGHEPLHLSALARDVYDVTGAGDTVISTLSLALGAGADLATAAKLANMAAGLAVEQVGTTIITLDLMRRAIEESVSGSGAEEIDESQSVRGMLDVSSEVSHA